MSSIFYSLLVLFSHTYHVSVCEIKQKDHRSNIEITHKIFTDDLEKAIENSNKTKLLLGNPSENKQAKELIEKYVRNHFSLIKDGKVVPTTFIGFELDTDQVFIYFEAKGIGKFKSLAVKYDPLIEVYEDQANMVHININANKTSLFLNTAKTQSKVVF